MQTEAKPMVNDEELDWLEEDLYFSE